MPLEAGTIKEDQVGSPSATTSDTQIDEGTPVVQSTHIENIKYCITSFDVWALGITVGIGGQYFSWNYGFSAGVGTYGVACLLIGMSYVCLTLCISEISSGLPFAGGSYGLARCTLGNYWGFLSGCSEAIEYIFHVSASVYGLGLMVEAINPDAHDYAPITWGMVFVISLMIHIYGGKHFWTFNMFLAIISIIILVIYCLGSLKYVDFTQYAAYPITDGDSPWFTGDMFDFMKVLPLGAWLFIGVEALKETCNDLDEPKIQIPRGQISYTQMTTAILVFFITISLSPGIVELSTNPVPFNPGFSLMFDLTTHESAKYLTILSIFATFATCFGFIMMYGKIIIAMADSALFPAFLNVRHSKTSAPYMALIIGSLLSYACLLVCYVYPSFSEHLYNIGILAAFLGYSSQCISYILLKTKYSNISCDFHNPFGIYDAIFSLCVWLFGIVAVIGFQDDDGHNITAVVVIYFVLSVWYFTYAKYQQSFSDNEKSIFFTIYIINHNVHKATTKKKFMRRASRRMRDRSELTGIRNIFGIQALVSSISNKSSNSASSQKSIIAIGNKGNKNFNKADSGGSSSGSPISKSNKGGSGSGKGTSNNLNYNTNDDKNCSSISSRNSNHTTVAISTSSKSLQFNNGRVTVVTEGNDNDNNSHSIAPTPVTVLNEEDTNTNNNNEPTTMMGDIVKSIQKQVSFRRAKIGNSSDINNKNSNSSSNSSERMGKFSTRVGIEPMMIPATVPENDVLALSPDSFNNSSNSMCNNNNNDNYNNDDNNSSTNIEKINHASGSMENSG